MPQWKISDTLIEYETAIEFMENRVAEIAAGKADECIWMLQHPPLYTAGTSAKASDLKNPQFPVFETGRGGQYTYHGPGQLVIYTMLNLKARGGDVRAFVCSIEQWIIDVLADYNITGLRRSGRVGIWVETQNGDEKIAALGIRVRRGVTFHGLALNINPNLEHFGGIVPCGLPQFGVTSMEKLQLKVEVFEIMKKFQEKFAICDI